MNNVVFESPKHSRPRPKQVAIIEDIRSQIVAGKLTPGTQLPTVASMQRLYGASDPTVQSAVRYLRKQGFVQTKERTGMFVSEYPPHLCNIGVVFPHYGYHSQFITALDKEGEILSQESSPTGLPRQFVFFRQVRCPSEDLRRHHIELFDAIQEHWVGGVILVGDTDELAKLVVAENPQLPCIGFQSVHIPGTVAIQSEGIRLSSLEMLASRGCRSTALAEIGFGCKAQTSEFIACARDYGIESRPEWVIGFDPPKVDWAENWARLLFNLPAQLRPEALIIDDDNLVPAVTAGIASAGIKVPEELIVVAHTNFPYPTPATVPVIRIGTDIRKLMQAAMDVIDKQRAGFPTQDVITFEPVVESQPHRKEGI